MRVPLLIGKKRGQSSAPAESAERLVNGYVETVTDGKEFDPVLGTPGLVLWASGLNGAIRGMHCMAGVLYAVAGTKLYSFSSAGVATECGDVPGSDLVAMDGDGTNLAIVAGGEIYIWNGTNVTAVADADAPSASSVRWLDGYFIFGETDTQDWFISAVDDPTNYDALDFASAEWRPDKLRTPVVLRRTLYLFGEKSIEAQQNTGDADFPFSRYQDIFINVGLAGRDAVCDSNDTLFWLAHDGTARRLDGITATRISDHAIERVIAGWSDQTATVASAHVWQGHLFVLFRNPEGCICFDQNTNRWHERRSQGSDTTFWRHLAECYGKALVGSASEGKIYELSATAYDEAGAILPFEAVTPYLYVGGKSFSADEVEIIAQMGVGGHDTEPKIALQRSLDGEEWETRQYRGLGKAGNRRARAIFGPQGSAEAMAFKIRITDAVQRAVLGIYADVDPER